MIACLRLPYFAAALEQRDDPRLQGLALVLVEDMRVAGVSAAAAKHGVRVGMPLSQAEALCGDLIVRQAAPGRYRRIYEELLEALTAFTPQVEPEEGLQLRADARPRRDVPFLLAAQVDDQPAATCYLDLGQLAEPDARLLARQLHRTVHARLEVPAVVGLASGKFPARVAATALSANELLGVSLGQEAAFLAPFTVGLLPIDGEMVRQLQLLGLMTLGQIALQPIAALLDRFGKPGRVMHRLASGRDTSPVLAYTPRAVYRVARQLEAPVRNWQPLHALLDALLGALLERVAAEGQTVRQIELALLQEDGQRRCGELILREPSSHGGHLRRTVHELAATLGLTSGVVELELALSGLGPSVPRQLSLFERDPVSQDQLRRVLHNLVARHGSEQFYWMGLTDPQARLPERRFRLERAGK